MKLKYLAVFLYIGIYLLGLELLFEVRAVKHGFHGHIIHVVKDMIESTENNQSEIKKAYPFRSDKLDKNKPLGVARFWMASASYAEDTGRTVAELFPNIFCRKLSEDGVPCQMINPSKAGFAIQSNIKQIETIAPAWKPDYAILYSMSLDINQISKIYFGAKDQKKPAEIITKVNKKNLSISEKISKQLEEMTIYGHLRRYFGGYILLSSSLHDDMNLAARKNFKQRILNFIKATRSIGATPVLCTFATKYNLSNYRQTSFDTKLFLVRYNEYLSARGWVNTVHEFNNVIRQTAKEQDIVVLDIAKEMSGKSSLFKDFVHFTKQGHEIIANIMAKDFLKFMRRANT